MKISENYEELKINIRIDTIPLKNEAIRANNFKKIRKKTVISTNVATNLGVCKQ